MPIMRTTLILATLLALDEVAGLPADDVLQGSPEGSFSCILSQEGTTSAGGRARQK
jgi:hypothetical protein